MGIIHESLVINNKIVVLRWNEKTHSHWCMPLDGTRESREEGSLNAGKLRNVNF